ncbi:TonB-dependent receptor [Luteibacter anthropi]|uniref:TonB-dependent receptor n=1 Tax=Luteibacter anthropi TaxID=564369 RepID=UPI002032DC9A|nr:TonB-dependent receptor [Luteibacter anthropi]URX61605.1 TonB-dependent receptor [Luteibacter anthropi]
MKKLLALGTALATAALSSTATAQSADTPQEKPATQTTDGDNKPTTLDSVQVTGIRRANEAAIESKLAANTISDVVSATDARALPDLTIVEALRRVPGLSVLPAIDNEHPRDEASTPVIRGLGSSYNNVTIDGLTVASPGTPNGNLGSVTRGVRLDILPSSMISEIGVVKTFTADQDPNAVGGAIDLRTRSAFDNGNKPFFTMEASLGHASDNGEPSSQMDPGYRVSGTGSTTFGSDHQYGVVVSANYQTLSSYTYTHMTSDTVFYNFYNAAGQLQSGNNLGNGLPVPQNDKSWYVEDKRDRYGITGKFEARPSDTFDAYLLGGYYYFKDNMTRNENIIDGRNGPVVNQGPTSGTYPVGDVEVGYSNQQITTRTKVGQAGFNWHPDDQQELSARASYSDATYDEPIYMVKFIAGATRPAPGSSGATVTPSAPFGFTYDTSRFNAAFPIDPSSYYNLNNYGLFYWRPDYGRNAADSIRTARLDYRFNQGEMDRGFGFATGAMYTDDRPSYSVHRDEYDPNTSAPPINLADFAGPLGASLPYNPGLNLLTIDPSKVKAFLDSLPKSDFNSTSQNDFNNQDNFEHKERIFGGYGLVTYATDQLYLQGGLHYDGALQSTVGYIRGTDKVYRPVRTSSDYRHLLPSLLGRYNLTDDFDIRAGYSRTLGRPPYDSYAARSSINFVNSSDVGNPNATGVSVTIGNPAIKPRVSDNYDLSFDWRLPEQTGGLVSVALFDKQIHDEIFTVSDLGFTDPSSGVFYKNAIVSTPVNASSARIRGAELSGIVNSFGSIAPWLRSFGASANVSFLDGRLAVPLSAGGTRAVDRLVGQPDYIVNATVFYNHNGLELRAAYNKQGRALRSVVSDVSWQDLYWAPRSQVDLSATYQISRDLALIGQVSNVGHSRITTITGPGLNLLKDSYSVPTTYWFGVRFTPKF